MTISKKLCIFHIDLNFSCLREDYLRKWLKKIADAGYNAILWEIEDKVRLDTCPECMWPEAYSKETFKDILKYSRSLGLEPIPLLQTVGHGEYILMHDKYRHLRESQAENHHDCYCTENPETRNFLKSLVREYLELFGDIRFFHLGGDEAYVFATCPKCADKVKHVGKNALYMEHISDISEPIRAAGARPGIWCDMILHHPEEMAAISKDYLIWDWNYWDSDYISDQTLVWGAGLIGAKDIPANIRKFFPEIIDSTGKLRPFYTSHALKRLGYDVILCSAIRAAGDSFLFPLMRRAENAVGAARACMELDLIGNCVTSWAIRLNPFETQEPMMPMAPAVFANPDLSLADAKRDVSLKMFGIGTTEFFDAAEAVGKNMPPFTCSGSMAVQWTNLKDSLPTPPDYLEGLILRWKTENNGAALKSWQERLEKSEKDISQAVFLMTAFILKSERGFDTSKYWLDALIMQLWMIRVGRMIFEGKVNAETVEILQKLKEKTLMMILQGETRRSANKNADLLFNWLIEYCRKKR